MAAWLNSPVSNQMVDGTGFAFVPPLHGPSKFVYSRNAVCDENVLASNPPIRLVIIRWNSLGRTSTLWTFGDASRCHLRTGHAHVRRRSGAPGAASETPERIGIRDRRIKSQITAVLIQERRTDCWWREEKVVGDRGSLRCDRPVT